MPQSLAWTAPSAASLTAFLAVVAFVVLAHGALMARAGARSARVAAGLGVWLAATGALPAAGVLEPGPLPPPLLRFFVSCLGAAVLAARSPLGGRIARTAPLWALVGAQAFRLPLELVLHRWHVEGVIPVQMTYDGLNLDIASGVVACAAGAILWRAPASRSARVAAWAATAVGLVLLAAVGAIAATSVPGPLRRFDGAPLLLPLHFPTVWIVSVCVAGALHLHLLTLRRLFGDARV